MFQYTKAAVPHLHTNDEYCLLFPPLCVFLADYIPSQMGLDGRVGGVVGGTGVVLASYFPSHVTEVWITFKTHVAALRLCAVWQLQRKRTLIGNLTGRGLDHLTDRH